MMSAVTMTRRTALLASIGAAAAATVPAACGLPPGGKRRKLSGTVRDHLWLWGHGTHTLDGQFGIPDGPVEGLAKSAATLGVPNVAVIRWMGQPRPPYGSLVKSLRGLNNVGWSVVDSAPETTAEKIEAAFALADRLPNMTTLYLDDLFVEPSKITETELADLHSRAREHDLELAAVLYVSQLALPGVADLLRHVDVVSLWAWDGAEIDNMRTHMATYRGLLPDVRTQLGVYMWDFGASAPIGRARMRRQLDLGLGWLRSGEVEGLIFHSSPLVSRPIVEVGMAKRWVAEHGPRSVRA